MELKYYIINKPHGYQSQFSGEEHLNLSDLFKENKITVSKDVYPVGRLDKDSEGLLVITNDKRLHTHLLNPKNRHKRTYWVQVDNQVSQIAKTSLEKGVIIRINKKEYKTLPCQVELIPEPELLWERDPPVRFRKNIPTSWIKMTLKEGKNRQIRRMTAKVGFPTLRLIRYSIENLTIKGLKNGKISALNQQKIYELLKIKKNY